MLLDELKCGAATVNSLAAHFEVLKGRAVELINSAGASERGFFTPTEDEQTRHLLVSYHQSRNALVELVTSFHDASRFDSDQRPMVLAIAYAGALTLVDGARFLRDNFHDKPVVRKKLNEAAPDFEIPQGTYDTIQKSLTNPRHAWHLYHAWRFVEQNWSTLNGISAQSSEFREVLNVIQRLQDRIKVSADRFVIARTRTRGRSLRNRLGRDLLGRGLYGLQKCVSRLMSERYLKSGHRPGLPAKIEAELERLLAPGDVIVTRKEHALTNYFLPGYWPHAALYVGSVEELQRMALDRHESLSPSWSDVLSCDTEQQGRVLEALKDGVRTRSLSCPLASDAIAIIRPVLEPALVSTAIARGFRHDGKPYDFDFDFTRSDRMVCTEVVYRSYEGIGGLEFQLTRRAGRLTLSAEDLLGQALEGDGFEIQCVFCPAKSQETLHGAAATNVIRSTLQRSA